MLLNFKKRGLIAGALLAVTAVVLTSCSATGPNTTADPPSSDDQWEISFVSDLSGPLSVYGTSLLGGLQTWFDQVNRNGGVAGREINLAVRDDRSDVQAGLAAFREALDSSPLVVLGPFVSSLTAAAAPLAQQQQVNNIMWSPIEALMDPPQEYLFAGAVTLDELALIQLSVIAQLAQTEDPKIVIGRLDTAAGEDFSRSAQVGIEQLGWELVGEERIAPTATDVSDQAAAMANTDADFCLCATFGPTNLQLMRALRSNGSEMIVVNYFGGSFASDMEALDDPNYYAVTNFVDPMIEGVPAAEEMRAQAETSGQERYMVGYSFTQGYVVGMAVTQALEACGNGCDSDSFREALRSAEFDFADLAGPATFSDSPFMIRSGRASHYVDGALEIVGDWQSEN